jgi:aminopeptidase N
VDRLTAVVSILLLVAATIVAAGDLEPVAYDLSVDIDPPAGAIEVAGTVTVRRPPDYDDPIELLLHDTFAVRQLRVDGRPVDHSLQTGGSSRLQPAARTVRIDVPKKAGPTLGIEIAYGGVLRRLPEFGTEAAQQTGAALDDAVTEDRVELASYSTWYPVAVAYGPRFDAELTIGLPAGWTVVSVGEPVGDSSSDGRVRSKWAAREVQDLVILASPSFEVERVEQGNAVVEIFSTELPPDFIRLEANEVGQALELFVDLLGPAGPGSGTVRQVFTPRAAGQGGYARAPLIVISEGRVRAALAENPDLSLLKGTAHEAAHFWWSFGTGQGDWINEAFAEYFGLVAVQRVRGEAAFERALGRTRTAVGALDNSAPSLAEAPASNDGDGYTIRYFKGALFVHALREALGDDAFFAGCRSFHSTFRAGSASTDDLRRYWSGRLGDQAEWLDRWLDTPGGEMPIRTTSAVEP